jgi:hypothetical protein
MNFINLIKCCGFGKKEIDYESEIRLNTKRINNEAYHLEMTDSKLIIMNTEIELLNSEIKMLKLQIKKLTLGTTDKKNKSNINIY